LSATSAPAGSLSSTGGLPQRPKSSLAALDPEKARENSMALSSSGKVVKRPASSMGTMSHKAPNQHQSDVQQQQQPRSRPDSSISTATEAAEQCIINTAFEALEQAKHRHIPRLVCTTYFAILDASAAAEKLCCHIAAWASRPWCGAQRGEQLVEDRGGVARDEVKFISRRVCGELGVPSKRPWQGGGGQATEARCARQGWSRHTRSREPGGN
jgi:hypothetical protein